jgi:hypothetical protein
VPHDQLLGLYMKKWTILLLILFPGASMAGGIFIHSHNETSGRYAILDEFGETGVLYLSEEGSQKPVRDAFAYMKVPPINKETWKERMKAGEPPTLHTEIASQSAVIPKTKENDFSFLWSSNGQAVALLYKGQAIAFISLNEKYGFSKAVTKGSPIVNPWDKNLYELLFSK